MRYTVTILPAALKALQNLSQGDQRRARVKIDGLADNPRPPGGVKLKGHGNLFRCRVGDYRIIYQIIDTRLLVTVIDLGHRREIYRDL